MSTIPESKDIPQTGTHRGARWCSAFEIEPPTFREYLRDAGVDYFEIGREVYVRAEHLFEKGIDFEKAKRKNREKRKGRGVDLPKEKRAMGGGNLGEDSGKEVSSSHRDGKEQAGGPPEAGRTAKRRRGNAGRSE
jgi:hypothetical protein